jgi:hypothetical protein
MLPYRTFSGSIASSFEQSALSSFDKQTALDERKKPVISDGLCVVLIIPQKGRESSPSPMPETATGTAALAIAG